MNWKGVIPAITTSFTEDLRVDHSFLTKHCHWLLDNGCAGVVALGSSEKARLCPSTRRSRFYALVSARFTGADP